MWWKDILKPNSVSNELFPTLTEPLGLFCVVQYVPRTDIVSKRDNSMLGVETGVSVAVSSH